MTEIPMTQRWVADRRSASQAAGAYTRLTLRRRRWWAAVAVIGLACAVLLGVSFDDRYGLSTRLLFGPVYALLPTLLIACLCLGLSYLLNRRRFRRRLTEGVVLESGFGERVVVLRGPWAESRLSFDGIGSVSSVGGWVFLQQIGSPAVGAWPAVLFPTPELARLEEAVGRR